MLSRPWETVTELHVTAHDCGKGGFLKDKRPYSSRSSLSYCTLLGICRANCPLYIDYDCSAATKDKKKLSPMLASCSDIEGNSVANLTKGFIRWKVSIMILSNEMCASSDEETSLPEKGRYQQNPGMLRWADVNTYSKYMREYERYVLVYGVKSRYRIDGYRFSVICVLAMR
ncbi:hypothetical protein Tco_0458631 [Tanacetum coccineum]